MPNAHIKAKFYHKIIPCSNKWAYDWQILLFPSQKLSPHGSQFSGRESTFPPSYQGRKVLSLPLVDCGLLDWKRYIRLGNKITENHIIGIFEESSFISGSLVQFWLKTIPCYARDGFQSKLDMRTLDKATFPQLSL